MGTPERRRYTLAELDAMTPEQLREAQDAAHAIPVDWDNLPAEWRELIVLTAADLDEKIRNQGIGHSIPVEDIPNWLANRRRNRQL